MKKNAYDRCVEVWVQLADQLGLFEKGGSAINLQRVASTLKEDTLKPLMLDIASQPGTSSWRRIAQLATTPYSRLPLRTDLSDPLALRATLTAVLDNLCICDKELSDRLWSNDGLDESAIRQIISHLRTIENGDVLTYVAALPLWCDSSKDGDVCSIKKSVGVWKKKSSYHRNYGSTYCSQRYSSLFKSSCTLLLCVAIAFMLILLGFY